MAYDNLKSAVAELEASDTALGEANAALIAAQSTQSAADERFKTALASVKSIAAEA